MKLNRKKNKKNKFDLKQKVILIIIFIIIDIFLIFSFIRIREAVNINQLNNKFDELLEIKFTSNDYSDEVNTTGKYKIVEKAMNDYFSNYSEKSREVLDITNSDKLSSLLSIESYNTEDHQFTETVNYITKTREDLDNKFEDLYNLSTEEGIEKYINNISDDPKVVNTFKKYMLSTDAKAHFDDCNSLLKKKQDEVNNILDVSREVFYFLIINDGKWLVKDGQIQFANDSLKQQYDSYIVKVK